MGLTGCRQFRRRTPRPATCISTPKGVNPKAATNRAYGLPLRCLQEEGGCSALESWAFLCKVPLAPAGAARHSKTGFCSAKPAGHTYPLESRRQRKELRAPSSSPRRRGMAATRALLRSADSLLADQFPGADPEKSYSAPRSLSARLGKFTRFNSSLKRGISLLRRGAHPSGVLLTCRVQPALSARWRKLAKQLTLFGQFPTPALARGILRELRSGRAGRPYAGRAVPPGTRYWPGG